jgi:hypothetical protein
MGIFGNFFGRITGKTRKLEDEESKKAKARGERVISNVTLRKQIYTLGKDYKSKRNRPVEYSNTNKATRDELVNNIKTIQGEIDEQKQKLEKGIKEKNTFINSIQEELNKKQEEVQLKLSEIQKRLDEIQKELNEKQNDLYNKQKNLYTLNAKYGKDKTLMELKKLKKQILEKVIEINSPNVNGEKETRKRGNSGWISTYRTISGKKPLYIPNEGIQKSAQEWIPMSIDEAMKMEEEEFMKYISNYGIENNSTKSTSGGKRKYRKTLKKRK